MLCTVRVMPSKALNYTCDTEYAEKQQEFSAERHIFDTR